MPASWPLWIRLSNGYRLIAPSLSATVGREAVGKRSEGVRIMRDGQLGGGPMALRGRKVDVSLAVCAFAVSFGITLAVAMLVTSHHGAARKADPPSPVLVHGGSAGYLTPTALDRQWITYSDQSTCADRAGGDGVSAVRLSSSQVAWFFSDSSLGPAGPSI